MTFAAHELVSQIKTRIISSLAENEREANLEVAILFKGKVLLDGVTLDQVLEDGVIGNAKFHVLKQKVKPITQ
jgi:hypothetical protein